MAPSRISDSRFVAAMAIGLALIGWAYWPGLGGPFLFDDFANLNVLGMYGQTGHWPALLYYLSAGTADPTGRPVALLSFLIDASTWPAAPWPFKRTNLCLHLFNVGLLAYAVARLQTALQRRHPTLAVSPWTPALAAMLWGAHPFFVSTTLYVVQREAMLPATFVLLALLSWDRAVICFNRQRVAGWGWALAGFGGATLLAGLSKGNGFLAPLLVLLAYVFFLRPDDRVYANGDGSGMSTSPTNGWRHRWRHMDSAAAICLGLPSLLLVAFVVRNGWMLWSMPQLPGRDWTLPERLLSEPRALWTYVGHLVTPRASGGGLFVEDFAPSRGWLTPWTTAPAMVALLGSAAAAIGLRRWFPIASFSWLFYLSGHLLESTTFPLELYFEHRNYLPALFLGWPLAHAMCRPAAYGRWRLVLAAAIMAGLLLLTHQRASDWGNEGLLNALSAAHEADSARAQVTAAGDEIARGSAASGLARIHALQRTTPGSVDVAINAIAFECQVDHAVGTTTLEYAHHALQAARNWNFGLYDWMKAAARNATMRTCRGFGLQGLEGLVSSALSNPQSALPLRKRDLLHVRGQIALAAGKPESALRWFNTALAVRPDAEYALVQAAALGDADAQALGIQHLDYYSRIASGNGVSTPYDMSSAHAWLLRHYGYYDSELSSLRRRLLADDQQRRNRRPTP